MESYDTTVEEGQEAAEEEDEIQILVDWGAPPAAAKEVVLSIDSRSTQVMGLGK